MVDASMEALRSKLSNIKNYLKYFCGSYGGKIRRDASNYRLIRIMSRVTIMVSFLINSNHEPHCRISLQWGNITIICNYTLNMLKASP